MTRWYRAYEGTVADPKLAEAAMVAGVSRSVAIAVWHAILESCAHDNKGGAFSVTPRNVSVTLQERLETVCNVFACFTELGMIADGAVVHWKRRQYESDCSTGRVRKYREKHKNTGNVDETFQQRFGNVTKRLHSTETDKEYTGNRAATRPSEPSRFDEFWGAYPRRQGANPKEPARKKFDAACRAGEDPDQIIAAAKRYAADMAAQRQLGTPYVAQALTWLNQRRWDDAPITVLPFGQAPPIRSPANTRC